MKTWARIESGSVIETLTTDQPIEALFPPSLVWIDASAQAGVSQGWRWTGASFAPPAPAIVPGAAAAPNLAVIAQQIAILQAQVATYSSATIAGASGSAGMASVVGGGGGGSVAGGSGTNISGSGSVAPVSS